MRTFAIALTLSITQLCYAEITTYESTDNTGLNKREQIGAIEKYLADLSGKLKNIETKLDENSNKIKALESTIAVIKENDIKKLQEQVSVKRPVEKAEGQKSEASELEKLKSDFLAIKNNDVEQIRQDISDLKFSVKDIQTTLKMPAR